jgi:hypothetical protein
MHSLHPRTFILERNIRTWGYKANRKVRMYTFMKNITAKTFSFFSNCFFHRLHSFFNTPSETDFSSHAPKLAVYNHTYILLHAVLHLQFVASLNILQIIHHSCIRQTENVFCILCFFKFIFHLETYHDTHNFGFVILHLLIPPL